MLKHIVLIFLITCVLAPNLSIVLDIDVQKKVFKSLLSGQPLEENHKECKSDASGKEELKKGAKLCCSVTWAEFFRADYNKNLSNSFLDRFYPSNYIEIITPPPKNS